MKADEAAHAKLGDGDARKVDGLVVAAEAVKKHLVRCNRLERAVKSKTIWTCWR